MPEKSSLPPVSLRPDAQAVRDDYLARVSQRAEKAKHKPMNILVWGANPYKAVPLAHKRLEIRAELANMGHNPMFSEEIVEALALADKSLSELPIKAHELAQAEEADYIVILMGPDAPGTSGEVHDFAPIFKIAQKMCILCPKSYAGGYTGDVVRTLDSGFHNVYWYTPDELSNCDVLTQALQRVRGWMNVLLSSQ